MKMQLKNLLSRLLFCLPFIAIVLYIHSYHGEMINNSKVEWQYVKSDDGKTYLALDVYAPSGIKIDSIFSHSKDITPSWNLINYPDWYKGKNNFDKLSEFQEVLHPYLPYHDAADTLYTTEWYTFLYEWKASDSFPMPSESAISIKYLNVGTENYYSAYHVSGIRLISSISRSKVDSPVIDAQMLYPLSYPDKDEVKIFVDNLTPFSSYGYILEDLSRKNYGIYIKDKNGSTLDTLKGFVSWDSEKVYQVYSKTRDVKGGESRFTVVLQHLAAIAFIVYFVFICWGAGLFFVRRLGISLTTSVSSAVISVFVGIILLTYLVFIVGLFKILYFPIVFAILVIILFLFSDPLDVATSLKKALINQLNAIKKNPFRILPLMVLLALLFYNLSYCFIPATFQDGSGDIVNSYLPNLNHYIISHSFEVPIDNSTTGIIPQAFEVLRAVMMMFAGEPGVYLLSIVYLVLMLGGVYLIGKECFDIKSMLIYITILLLLSSNLFTEGFHLGKWNIIALSFLLIFLYSIRFSEHKTSYILPPLILAFLTSQYPFFGGLAVVYFLFVISYSFYNHGTIKAPVFRLHITSIILFSLLSSLFVLKLLLEAGVPFPPGIMSDNLYNLFLKVNQSNEFYRYLSNDYIRHFYSYHSLAVGSNYDTSLWENIIIALKRISRVEFAYIFLFMPLLLIRPDRHRIFYIILVMALILIIALLFPINPRVRLYYFYPFVILQFAIFNDLMLASFRKVIDRFVKGKKAYYVKAVIILLVLSYVVFEAFPTNFKLRRYKWVSIIDTRIDWFSNGVPDVFFGKKSKYRYLQEVMGWGQDREVAITSSGGGGVINLSSMSTQSYWDTATGFPQWATYDFKAKRPRMLRYLLQTGPHGEDATQRMPRDWKLQASDDGLDWITIDIRKNQTDWKKNEVRIYSIEPPGAYRYYRLYINSGIASNVLRLYRFRLYEEQIEKTLKVKSHAPVESIYLTVDSGDLNFDEKNLLAQTYWETTKDFPHWVTYDFKTEKPRMLRYILQTGPHGEDPTQRMPRDWKLQASDDGLDWITIDIRENQTDWEENEIKIYNIETPAPYRFYRLYIGSGINSSVLRLYRFRLYEEKIEKILRVKSHVPVESFSLTVDAEGPGYEGRNLLLMSTQTYWETTKGFPHWVTYDFKTARPRMLRYLLQTGPHGDDATQRMPRDWKLQASDDGLDWITIDNRENQTDWKENEIRIYNIKNPASSRYYRLLIDSGNDSNMLRLYRFRLYEEEIEKTLKVKSHVPVESFSLTVDSGDPDFEGRNLLAQTYWETAKGFPHWVTYDFKSARSRMSRYLLQTGPHGDDATQRMPRDWELQASEDGLDWITIDNRENQTDWKENEIRIYNIKNPASSRYYRLLIDSGNDSNMLRLYRFRLYEEEIEKTLKVKSHVPVESFSLTVDSGDPDFEGRNLLAQTYWETAKGFPHWVTYDFKSARSRMSRYLLQTGPHGDDATQRMPRDWELQASDDGLDWITIDIRKNQTDWRENEIRIYNIKNPVPYRYYRLYIDSGNDSNMLRLYRFRLYEEKIEKILNVKSHAPVESFSLTVDSGYEGRNLLSMSMQTYWETTKGFPHWVTYDFKSGRPRMLRYLLQTGPHGDDSTQRMPRDWKLQASDDDLDWITIDKRENQTDWKENEMRIYNIKNPVPYRFYRLYIESGNDSNMLRLYRFRLYEKKIEKTLKVKSHVPVESFSLTVDSGDPDFEERNLLVQTFWETTKGFPHWITYDFKAERPGMLRYLLQTGPHGDDSTQRMPRDWELQASDDGLDWITIDKRENQTDWKENEMRIYNIKNPVPYRFYRLYIESGNDSNMLRLYRFRLYEEKIEKTLKVKSHAPVESFSLTVDAESPGYEGRNLLSSMKSFWETTKGFPHWVTYDFKSGRPGMLRYLLQTGPHGDDATQRMPRDWELQASDDGLDWITIDKRENQTDWKENEIRVYNIKNPGSYRYYRLYIESGNNSNMLRLYKFRLYEEEIEKTLKVKSHAPDESFSLTVDAESPGFEGRNLLSMSMKSFWETTKGFPHWVTCDFKAERPGMLRYLLQTGTHGENKMPRDWELQASDDGRNWITIDNQENQTDWKENETRIYNIKNPALYRYYRLYIGSGNDSNMLRLYKFRLYEEKIESIKEESRTLNEDRILDWETLLDGAINKISNKYQASANKNFNHSMLIRQYTDVEDTILIVPVRFHSHAMRHITARHALGSVIYQKDISKIMADLKRLNIRYLSYVPIHYKDYNPFYTPIFEDDTFYKYFKLIFSDNGSKFYKIIYDGTNEEYTSTPYDVKGLPFVPMQ